MAEENKDLNTGQSVADADLNKEQSVAAQDLIASGQSEQAETLADGTDENKTVKYSGVRVSWFGCTDTYPSQQSHFTGCPFCSASVRVMQPGQYLSSIGWLMPPSSFGRGRALTA